MNWQILQGDVRDQLAGIPTGSVQCCVTSPPYWGLRDYGHAGQLGLERTPDAYVAALVGVLAEVRRTLAAGGTLWLNLGDSYQNAKGQAHGVDPKQPARRHGLRPQDVSIPGLKPKDLVGIPWMVAFALRADGWYLRSDIIWHKPNPMPESITDRPTKAHEYLFLLSKSLRYYYDAAAIREPGIKADPRLPHERMRNRRTLSNDVESKPDKQRGHGRRHAGFNDRWDSMPKAEQQQHGANKRTVWTVATHPYPDAHFATYPPALIEPCILAGSRPGDTVLDPFNGSGTTGEVAIRHQRNYIGIELNPAYIELARKRISAVAPMFAQELTA